jgi:hypothetical protein
LFFSKHLGTTGCSQRRILSVERLPVSADPCVSNRRHFAPDICTGEVVEIGSIFVCASLSIFALGKRQAANPGHVSMSCLASAMSLAWSRSNSALASRVISQ